MKKSTMDALDRAHERAKRQRRREEAKRAASMKPVGPEVVDLETAVLWPYKTARTQPRVKIELDTTQIARQMAEMGRIMGEEITKGLQVTMEDIGESWKKAKAADVMLGIDPGAPAGGKTVITEYDPETRGLRFLTQYPLPDPALDPDFSKIESKILANYSPEVEKKVAEMTATWDDIYNRKETK